MNLFLTEKARGQAYLVAIVLASLLMRLLMGIIHPHLNLEQTVLVGVTTVLLTAPSLYRFFFGASLVKPEKRVPYVVLSAVSSVMFLYFIALQA